MVSNVRDRNIDSSRREDSRKGQVDRCEVINVRPHVAPYPDDKDFNTVDVQLIDRPRVNGKPLTIKYVKLNSLQRYHGRFQGEPWNARIGDMVYIYWLAEREALVLGLCTSVEQEPVCRSQADAHHQEYVFKLCPWEEPKPNGDMNYVDFPDPKHPECYKWWPKTRDSLWIFDCLEGHNTPSCCAQACNSLDDHQDSTCFKNFSDLSPTAIDLPRRFKFLHRCGSYWYYDNDGTIHIAGKVSGDLKNQEIFYPSGKILLENVVDSCSAVLDDDGDIKLNPLKTVYIDGDLNISGSCTHGSCSCEGEFATLEGVAGGQTLCGGTEEDEELTLCGTSDASKGCVKVDADLECTGNAQLPAICGGDAAGDDIEIQATAHATKGCIKINGGSANVDPSLTYGADCPCYIETAGLQLAMGCEVNSPYAFWMQVRQSTNISWSMHIQPLGGDVLVGNASGGGSNLTVMGDITADNYYDGTPGYNGDALAELKNVTNDAQGRISHKTLPAFARANHTDPETGKVTEGRNIGNMVSILTKAVQQLAEKLEAAEKKIVELEARL